MCDVETPGSDVPACLCFSGGVPARWNPASDEEINAISGNITIVRTPGHLQPRDERLFAGPPEAGGPRTIPVPVVGENDSLKTFTGWQFVTAKPSNIRHESERTLGLWKAPAVEMEVPHDSPGIIVLGPLRPLAAGSHLVHASALLQTCDLVNHSATLGLAFFGENPSAGILPHLPERKPPLIGSRLCDRGRGMCWGI